MGTENKVRIKYSGDKEEEIEMRRFFQNLELEGNYRAKNMKMVDM